MMAKVIVPFRAAPDGETDARSFEAGADVTGDLAAVAVQAGLAEIVGGDEPADETVRPADPFDHDGDGKPGGSKPRRKRR